MHDAKTNLSKLVAALERGETDEIEIARAGRVVARLVHPRPARGRTPGAWAGRVTIHPDFEELPEDVAVALRGELE
jgi:antitoxin (DNA-binding transcriptional repressor) of toxin-antitoxin stability system